jgi:hypothetical protein
VTREAFTVLEDENLRTLLTSELPPADADGAKRASTMLTLRGSGSDAFKLARDLARVARDVADAAHGWVFDPLTFRLHTAAGFHEYVPGDHLDVRKLVVVHTIIGDGEQPFQDTAGMRRYGLPELYVREVATGQVDQVAHLVNGAAQVLVDGGDVDVNGALAIDFHKLGWEMDIIAPGTGKATWKTRWAREHDAEDGDELVVELLPPPPGGAEGASKLVKECLGRQPDNVTMLEADDPEILAAAAKARDELKQLRSYFAKGVPPNELLSV